MADLNLTEDKATELSIKCREGNEKVYQWACYGIIYMCHCFIKENRHLIYFVPLILSLFSIGANWYSNWRFYYYFEKRKDIPKFSEKWCLALAGCAMLFFAIFYLYYNLLSKIHIIIYID